MKYIKPVLILTLVILTLLSIASVCASDVNDTALSSDNSNYVIDESNINDNKENNKQTFTALQNKIDDAADGSTITLENDYVYNGFDGPIMISKALTIDGKGFTIDGANEVSLFYVTNSNVVFKNIVFANGKSDERGGAIDGKCTAVNCIFNSNSARYGGAMNGGNAVDCTFNSNSAELHGGAIIDGNAVRCNFIKNKAIYDGGALMDSNAVDCIFNSNKALDYGGAMYGGNAKNCKFIGNTAEYHGGATIETTAVNCIFTKNIAQYGSGGAMNGGTAINCIFKNNKAAHWGDDTYVTKIISKKTNKQSSKATPKLIVKKAAFKVNVKIKKYAAILKTNKNKAMGKVTLFLKVKGKTYTAKTNSKGKAIFKIKNLKKKGNYNAAVIFKGNKNFKKVTKSVRLIVK